LATHTKDLSPESILARREDILWMHEMGETDERIALRIGLTVQQVQKIIQKYG